MTVTPHELNDDSTTTPQAASSVAVAATGAIFSTAPAANGSLVVTVLGDIDMRSAPILADYVCKTVAPGASLVLDLAGVDFFGIAGLTVFGDLDELTERMGAKWSLVESHAVHRLLEAASVVPSVRRFASVAEALA